MAYLSLTQILGELPSEWRDAALQDSEEGRPPAEVWAELQASVEDDIAGALTPGYGMPPPDADPVAVPLLRKVRSVARHLTLAMLYRRRGIPNESNPWAQMARDSLADLRRMGQGADKGPPGPPKVNGGIRVIGEASRLTRSGGCSAGGRRRCRGHAAPPVLVAIAAIFITLLALIILPRMESYDLLESLEKTLKPEVESLKGTLTIHGSEADAATFLFTSTNRWRLCLLADEEVMQDDPGDQHGGIVDHVIKCLVQHQEGPLMTPGGSQFKPGMLHGVPLLERCTQVRLMFLRLEFLRASAGGGAAEPARDMDHATGIRYTGRRPYIPGEQFLTLRTWQMTFRLRAGLMMPAPEDKNLRVLLTR